MDFETPGDFAGAIPVQAHKYALDTKYNPRRFIRLGLTPQFKKLFGRARIAFRENMHMATKSTWPKAYVYLFMRGYIGGSVKLATVFDPFGNILGMIETRR